MSCVHHHVCKRQVLASGWEHGNTWGHVFLNGYLWHFNVGYDIWVSVFTICSRVRDVKVWSYWWESDSMGPVFVQRYNNALLLPNTAALPSPRAFPKGDRHTGIWNILHWASSQSPSVKRLLVELGWSTGLDSRMKQDLLDSNSTSYHQLIPNVQGWQSPKSPVRRKEERVMWQLPAFTGRQWLSLPTS